MKMITGKLDVPEDEEEETSNWPNLPQDMAESILRKLVLIDYLRFGAICSSWRTSFLTAITSKHCPPQPQLPLLLLSPTDLNPNRTPSFFSLNKQEFIHPETSLYAKSQYCAGSFEGWLIIVDRILVDLVMEEQRNQNKNSIHVNNDPSSWPYFFLNPVSGARIALPSSFTLPQNPTALHSYLFYKMVASSSPKDRNCTVVGRGKKPDYFAFCKISEKSWTVIELKEDQLIADIEFHKGKLYVLLMGTLNFMIVYDFRCVDAIDGRPKPYLLFLRSDPIYDTIRRRVRGNSRYFFDDSVWQLVNDPVSGELLLIIREAEHVVLGFCYPPIIRNIDFQTITRGFRVSKLIESGGGHQRWEAVDDLGDRLVFVSDKGCKVISDLSNNCPKELVGRNCIYFSAVYQCLCSCLHSEIGMFCLNDKCLRLLAPLVPVMVWTNSRLPNGMCEWFRPSILV